MRITDNKQVHQALRAYAEQTQRQTKKPSRQQDSVGHEIQLSPASQEFLAAAQALRELPDVDVERVAALKQQIEAGTYRVDSERIARRMLANPFVDDRI